MATVGKRDGDFAGLGTKLQNQDPVAYVFLTLCWTTAIVLVNPIGEFPAVDDWAYLKSVQALFERGEIVFSDWSAPNLITHILWGALFAVPLGVSYTTLRFSTLVAALLAALALYRLLRDANAPVSVALLASLSLLFNPIFFSLSFTYMTDVTFVAAQTGAILFLLAGLRRGSNAVSAVGWSLALVAQLCRQTGLAIPFAWAAAYLVKNGFGIRWILVAASPIAAFIAAQWTYEYWLQSTGRLPLQFGRQLQSVKPMLTGSPSDLVSQLLDVSRNAYFYLGLFLLPITLPIAAMVLSTISRKAAFVTIIGIAALTFGISTLALRSGLLMPIWPHTWRAAGVGYDGRGIVAPQAVLEVVTVFSIFGGTLLLLCLACAIRQTFTPEASRNSRAWTFSFGVVLAAVLAGILTLIKWKFDRYLLPIIPGLALAIVFAIPPAMQRPPIWAIVVSSLLMACMAGYSVANTHNYLAEKRVIAAAIDRLVATGVPRDTIDGTWPFNGDRFYGRFGRKNSFRSWYRTRDYVVGFKPEAGYDLLDRRKVPRLTLWGRRGMDVLVYGPKAAPTRGISGQRKP